MSSKIEIFENTLLKLLVRRGPDSDRKNVILSQGELGYTTDTSRLFVGDGQTLGGKIAGNIYGGGVVDITSLTDVTQGDFAFNTDTNSFFVLTGDIPGDIQSWVQVGGVYTAADNTINISNINGISVGTISAANLSRDVAGNSIELDSNNRLSLSGSGISTNQIITRDAQYLGLPRQLRIDNVQYNWPIGGLGTDRFLGTDITGNLTWRLPPVGSNLFVSGQNGQIPVGSILPFTTADSAPVGWLLCNGQSVLGSEYPDLSAVIGTTYGGDSTSFNVPDLINKALYGVNSDPSNSPTLSIDSQNALLVETTSPTVSSLSAAGILYIIKAIPDNIVNSSITIGDGLTALQGSVLQSVINPLSGEYTVGIDSSSLSQILANQPNIAIASAAVSFNQAASIRTNISVAAVSLSSAAALQSYTGQTYSGVNPGSSTFKETGTQFSGVYVIDFTNPIANHVNALLQINAFNWRQASPGGSKVMHNSVPLYDYAWISNTKLIIGIVSTNYSNSDKQASGNLLSQFVDSGTVNSNTNFSVVIYVQ